MEVEPVGSIHRLVIQMIGNIRASLEAGSSNDNQLYRLQRQYQDQAWAAIPDHRSYFDQTEGAEETFEPVSKKTKALSRIYLDDVLALVGKYVSPENTMI